MGGESREAIPTAWAATLVLLIGRKKPFALPPPVTIQDYHFLYPPAWVRLKLYQYLCYIRSLCAVGNHYELTLPRRGP